MKEQRMKNKFLLGMKQKREMFARHMYLTRQWTFFIWKKFLEETLKGKKPGWAQPSAPKLLRKQAHLTPTRFIWESGQNTFKK